jgi:hypothetical protein
MKKNKLRNINRRTERRKKVKKGDRTKERQRKKWKSGGRFARSRGKNLPTFYII